MYCTRNQIHTRKNESRFIYYTLVSLPSYHHDQIQAWTHVEDSASSPTRLITIAARSCDIHIDILSMVLVAPSSSISAAMERNVAVEDVEERVAVDIAEDDATTVARVVGVFKVVGTTDIADDDATTAARVGVLEVVEAAEVVEVVVSAASISELPATTVEEATMELALAMGEVVAIVIELVLAADDTAADDDDVEFEPGPDTLRVTSPDSMYTPLK